jgi:hypothetical protein
MLDDVLTEPVFVDELDVNVQHSKSFGLRGVVQIYDLFDS